MNYEKILLPYKNLPVPARALYARKPDAMELFLTVDSPLAFLELSKEEQKTLVNWCKRLEKVGTQNRHVTSYGLKHKFEWDHFYINNGQFKGAMLIAGFTPGDVSQLNWTFNISKRSINILERRTNRIRWRRYSKLGATYGNKTRNES